PAALLRAAHHDALPAELQDDARLYLSTHAWSRALVEGFDAAAPPLPDADQDRLLARIEEQTLREANEDRAASSPAWWFRPMLAMWALAVAVLAVGIWRGAFMTAPSARPEPVGGRTAAPGSTSSPRAGVAPTQPAPDLRTPPPAARDWTLPLE